MGNLESGNTEQGAKQEIPGFKGVEKLESTQALKSGSFREFLNKVMEMRQNPATEKQAHDEIKKIDENTSLPDDEKKSQLRAVGRTKLFTTIAKHIEFGEKGIEITLDFGDLAFAEQRAIGAGDILPPNLKKIAFSGTSHEAEQGSDASASIGTRTIGANGREYRSEKKNYMASYTGTKLFIAYDDIQAASHEEVQQMDETEEASNKKTQVALQESKKDHKALKENIEQKPATAPETPETRETLVSHSPVFIGDSQMEGMAPYLRSKGVKAIDLRSMKMENIAAALKNPDYVNTFYKKTKSSDAFANARKARLIEGINALKTADTVVLQCGGNNIVQGWSLEKMKKAFDILTRSIKDINPNIKIHAGLMLIHGPRPTNDVAAQYNDWLKSLAAKGSIHIVDSSGIMMSYRTSHSEKKFGEGRHLLAEEYRNLATKALEAINYRT